MGARSTVNAGPDFTIVAIPDTQHYSEQVALTPIYNAQTQWIVNTQDDLNTAFVTHLGDIVENSGPRSSGQRADAAQDILDNNGVKNSVPPGNHDMNTATASRPTTTSCSPRRASWEPVVRRYLGQAGAIRSTG